MTIALTPRRRFEGYRFELYGELSQNADWTQTLDLPDDGNAIDITGETVTFELRDYPWGSVSVSVTLTVSDANTLTISAPAGTFSALCGGSYVADIKGVESAVTTHWAHGSVVVRSDPAS